MKRAKPGSTTGPIIQELSSAPHIDHWPRYYALTASNKSLLHKWGSCTIHVTMDWASSAWWTWAVAAHLRTPNGRCMRTGGEGKGKGMRGRDRSAEGRAGNCNEPTLSHKLPERQFNEFRQKLAWTKPGKGLKENKMRHIHEAYDALLGSPPYGAVFLPL